MLEHALNRRIAILLAALLVALTLSSGLGYAEGEPVKIKVPITDNGFNGDPNYMLEVEQGKSYELTFVFAQKGALGDGHVIVLKGYGVETDEIGFHNPEVALKFVANRPGTFELTCSNDCDIHDKLKSAHLKVKGAAGGSGAAALEPTALTLFPSAWQVAEGPVKLSATLKDGAGNPVPKATVRFYVDGEFAGTKGAMEVGAAKTDAKGMAAVSYNPTFAGQQQVAARFEGMGIYAESEKAVQIKVASARPAYAVAPIGLDAIRSRAPIALAMLVLSIWCTFGFVLYQIYGVRREGAEGS